MRTQRAGQATFLPLDTISTKPINDKFRSFARGARLAVDVIQFEPAVERAMLHACGNALVCDTMDVARYVCWERGQEVKGRLTFICENLDTMLRSGQLLHWRAPLSIRVGLLLVGAVRTGEERSGRRRTCKVGSLSTMASHTHLSVGLTRLRDNLVAQLQELNRSKPRGKADENVIAEITRLESAIAVVRDDLVRSWNSYRWHYNSLIVLSGM
jgi:structural maintenance of chromosome 1